MGSQVGDRAPDVRPGPQNKLCDGICQGLAQAGLKRPAGTQNGATTGPRCGSGPRNQRSRTRAQAWSDDRAVRPGSRLWPGSEVRVLSGKGARRKAWDRGPRPGTAPRTTPPSWRRRRRRRRGRGVAWRDPNKPTCGPGRAAAVTSRRAGARARLTLAAGRKARKVAGPCGPGTSRSASRLLPMPCPPFRPAQTLSSRCAALPFGRASVSALSASRGPPR